MDAAWAHLGSDRARGIAAHSGSAADIDELVSVAEDGFGTVQVLVNNAGTNPYHGPIQDATEAAWDKTMAVNVKGPWLCARHAIPLMPEGSVVINVASVQSFIAQPLVAATRRLLDALDYLGAPLPPEARLIVHGLHRLVPGQRIEASETHELHAASTR